MSKKSRRSKAKHRAKLAKQVVSAAEVGVLARGKVTEKQVPVDRYQYVMSDLRRIGILGGSIIVILIALSFILG